MFKPVAFIVVASVPLLPLSCQSSDTTVTGANGGNGHAGKSGSAGISSGGKASGGTSGADAGAIDEPGGAAGDESLGTSSVGGSSAGSAGGNAGPGGGGAGGSAAGAMFGAAGGGATGLGGSSGMGGLQGTGGLGAACGDAGGQCCRTGAACSANLNCLAATTCSCVSQLVAGYTLRVDGAILQSDGKTAVADATTALPLTQMLGLSDGRHHGCSYKSGSAWCWPTDDSGNQDGQLGNGTAGVAGPVYRASKVLVSANTPLGNVSGLAEWSWNYYGSRDASCAVTTSGRLYCWGNLSWLVNNGTALLSPYAQVITTDGLNALTGVVQASLGAGRSACAVIQTGTADHEVRCWGFNNSYNLGQGDAVNRQYPTKVLGLTNPSKVVIVDSAENGGNRATSCALDGGQVRCWGDNSFGTAGINAATETVAAPTLVKLQSNAVLDQIVDLRAVGLLAGFYGYGPAFCALRSDHTVWCWSTSAKFATYAANYGATNVVALGAAGPSPIYLTSDAVYHQGSAMTQSVNCGPLQ